MSTNEETLLRDVRQRVTRIESRLVSMGEQLGAVMHSSNKAMVLSESGTEVDIVGLDTSFSDVLHFLEKEGIQGTAVRVFHKERHVATINPTGGG